jgi:hypothetical protein
MNHVRVTTITGQEVDVSFDEIRRVMKIMHLPPPPADEFHAKVEEHNEHYLHKANENIRNIAEKYGCIDFHGTEDESKDLISCLLPPGTDLGALIVVVAVQRIAVHYKKIYSE